MSHPYKHLPDHAFWRSSVGDVLPSQVDPVVSAPFVIDKSTKIATAGSCFAQHIARHLTGHGFDFLVTEQAHPLVSQQLATKFGYGTFTARYGNIYTSRQLLQLLHRAYGTGALAGRSSQGANGPRRADDIWMGAENTFVDAYRPLIQPGGFQTRAELLADRESHLACVRRAFEELDVFIFTLRLTECWGDKTTGAVYPLCPGVAGGTFNADEHFFHNLGVHEVVADLREFADLLAARNAEAKVILTVSPVPLVATASGQHVLSATTYSNSVLRVAAETLTNTRANVAYFPSYEIITGQFSRGKYFAEDLRSVTEEGVAHVMRLFLKHFAGVEPQVEPQWQAPKAQQSNSFIEKMAHVVDVNCDEEALDQPSS